MLLKTVWLERTLPISFLSKSYRLMPEYERVYGKGRAEYISLLIVAMQ